MRPVVYRLRIASRLTAARAELWREVSTMDGVNRELAPIRMSAPRGARVAATLPLGQPLFRSVVSWRGLVWLDVHALGFAAIDDGVGFHERSTSWLERRWEHRRTLREAPDGCEVRDELEFEPRVAPLAPLVAGIVARAFERRHRYLRARFGASPDQPGAVAVLERASLR